MKSKPLVIYHGDCPDGFGAAFAAWLVFGDEADYFPGVYGKAPPDVTGRDVYILDFSFEIDVMDAIDAKAASLLMLDHHKSAKDKLGAYKCRCGQIHFDLQRSGSRMAWEYFHPDAEVPEMIRLIEDRDLWKWNYPESRDYLAALDAEGYDFQGWKRVLAMEPYERVQFLARGKAMNDKFRTLCESFVREALPLEIDGVKGLMVSASVEFASDVGSMLAEKTGTFGAVWKLEAGNTLKISLRSNAPFEVEPYARRFGGGGHPQAASMRLPADRIMDLIKGKLYSL